MKSLIVAASLLFSGVAAQASAIPALSATTAFSSASSFVGNIEAKGRSGSHRVGGHSSHGKGSHYVGGRK